MTDDPNIEDPDVPPPPTVGELLPRAAEAFGLRYKLETYSLDPTHKRGGPVRTVWAFDRPGAPPRLVNAFPKK